MINTLNESSLHKSLKILYSQEEGSLTEVKEDGVIYDILTKEGNVIEIQTQNLEKLLEKTQNAIKKGRKVKIVYPLVIEKKIEVYSFLEDTLISSRKSPVKKSIYFLPEELTGIYPALLLENVSLDVIFVKIIEKRIQTEKEIQSQNKRRRFKKNWLKKDKKLTEIIEKRTFETKKDYLSLLPQINEEVFCAKEVEKAIKVQKESSKQDPKKAHIILWLLSKMNLITLAYKKGNTKYYKINNPAASSGVCCSY